MLSLLFSIIWGWISIDGSPKCWRVKCWNDLRNFVHPFEYETVYEALLRHDHYPVQYWVIYQFTFSTCFFLVRLHFQLSVFWFSAFLYLWLLVFLFELLCYLKKYKNHIMKNMLLESFWLYKQKCYL